MNAVAAVEDTVVGRDDLVSTQEMSNILNQGINSNTTIVQYRDADKKNLAPKT